MWIIRVVETSALVDFLLAMCGRKHVPHKNYVEMQYVDIMANRIFDQLCKNLESLHKGSQVLSRRIFWDTDEFV